MNLNIINLDCSEWSREDWVDAYTAYCKTNMFGPMTKKEYYDFVCDRSNRAKNVSRTLSNELSDKWLRGFRNAVVWAKKQKCDTNGQSTENIKPQIDINELADDVKDIQWQLMQK